MPTGTDLVGALRAYAQKALGNDFNAEKAATALNAWVKESGDALKERIERETERAVKKLGLAKESEVRELRREIATLRAELGLEKKRSGQARKSAKSSKARKTSARKVEARKKKAASPGAKRKNTSAQSRKKKG